MTPHPSEDALIEHACGESAGDERARLETHLAECAECQRTWGDITAALTMVDEAVPEPRPGFEHLMWTRVKFAIAEDAARPAAFAWTWRQLVPAGVLAAAVVIGVGLVGVDGGRALVADPGGSAARAVTPVDARDAAINERVLYTALDAHLQQAEALLVELRNAPDRDNLDVERGLADDLVSAGRLYRLTAEMTGYRGAVQVLDDLEPLLVEVARGSQRIDARDRAWFRTRIETDDLLFKVRAVTTDVRERAGND